MLNPNLDLNLDQLREDLITALKRSAIDAHSALTAMERAGRSGFGWHMATENGLALVVDSGAYRLGPCRGDCSHLALEHTKEHATRISEAWNKRLTPDQAKAGCAVRARLRASILRATDETARAAVTALELSAGELA